MKASAEQEERETFDVAGNRLSLIVSGRERLDALIRLIDGAERSLRVIYYIYADDAAGRTVRDALERACRRGVEVHLIIDGFGCELPHGFFECVEATGGSVCHFLPRYGRRYLLRNHQKLVVADSARVLVGGFNVTDDYFSDGPEGWRDLGLLVDGPAAAHIVEYFDALSAWTHDPKARLRDMRRIIGRCSQHEGAVRWLLGGPTRRLSPWALELRRALKAAKRVDIVSAYLAPNPRMLRAVERVTARGGRARVIAPTKSDHAIAIAAARHLFARLLRRGVEVWEYLPQKLHAKLFVIDDAVQIGSANFDMRSLYLNLEIMLRIDDAAFADHVRRHFDRETAQAHRVSRTAHAKAGWLDRMRWSAAYFLMAVVDTTVTRRLNFGIERMR